MVTSGQEAVGALAALVLSLDVLLSGHGPSLFVAILRLVAIGVLLGLSSSSLVTLSRLPSINEPGELLFVGLVMFYADCIFLSLIGALTLVAMAALQVGQSALLLALVHIRRTPLSVKLEVDRQTALYTAVVVGAAIAVAFWLRASAGFVLQVDADIVKEALRTQYIIDQEGFRGAVLGGGVSVRPVLGDDLLAGFSIVGGVGAYKFAWAGTFLTIPMLAVGTFWLGKWLFDNLTGAVGGLLVLAFCGYFYFEGPEYVLPETLTIGMLLLGLPFLVRLLENQSIRGGATAAILLLVSSSGYFYGLIILLPVIAGMVLAKRRTTLVALGTLILGVALFVNGSLVASSASVFSWSQEVQLWQAMYTLVGLALGLSGAYLLLTRRDRSTIVGFYVFFVFLVSIIGIPEADRLQYWVRPFLAIAAAYACVYICEAIVKERRGVQLFTLTIIVFLLPSLVVPNSDWVHASEPFHPWSGTPYAYNTPDETNAGYWIQSHYGSDAFIVSDLDTSVIVQSICGCQGGWNPISFLNNTALLIGIYSTLSGNSSFAIMKDDPAAAKVPMVAVVSTRTPVSVAEYRNLLSSNATSSLNLLRVYAPPVETNGEAPMISSLEKQGFSVAASFNSVEVLTNPGRT